MAGLRHSVQSFMNAEETIIAKKKKKGERLDNGYIHHPEQGPHPKGLRWQEGRSSSGRYSNYTPLNTLLEQVLMQIKDDPSLKWLKRMKGDSSKRNKGKYYHFYHDHGRDTDECYDLK